VLSLIGYPPFKNFPDLSNSLSNGRVACHWPTDEDIYVDFVRDGGSGNGAARSDDPRWRRLRLLQQNILGFRDSTSQGLLMLVVSVVGFFFWTLYVRMILETLLAIFKIADAASPPSERR
jgi:hypothetical protein